MGGAGSGDFGHAGRPGEQGGSGPGGGGGRVAKGLRDPDYFNIKSGLPIRSSLKNSMFLPPGKEGNKSDRHDKMAGGSHLSHGPKMGEGAPSGGSSIFSHPGKDTKLTPSELRIIGGGEPRARWDPIQRSKNWKMGNLFQGD